MCQRRLIWFQPCLFFSHVFVSGNRYESQTGKWRSSSPAPDTKAKTDAKPLQRSGSRIQSPWRGKSRFPCQHPPVCQNFEPDAGCIYGKRCRFRLVEAEEKPSKKSKKGGAQGSDALLKEYFQSGCVSQDSQPRKSIPQESTKIGI